MSCCSTFLIPVWWGIRGRVFVPICCRHLNTHTPVCNRQVEVTKKFVWPCCEIFFLSHFSACFGTEVGQAVVPAQLLTGHTSSSIRPPLGYTLGCAAFCQISDFLSVTLSITHSRFVQNVPRQISIPLLLKPYISLCTSGPSLLPPDFPPPTIFSPST